MKNIEVKMCNPNPCGSDDYVKFHSVKELKVYLNEALYYAEEVYLNVPSLSNYVKYSKTNDIASLLREAKFYGEYLEVIE